jgi:hypothetical protein
MKPLPTLLLALAACTGDDPQDGPPCDQPGNICTWLGVPEQARGATQTTPREETWLNLPQDIAFTSDGTGYYPDFNNHRIRRVSPDGMVDTISGTTFLGDGPNDSGSTANCWAGCDAPSSAWNHPTHVTVNPAAENEIWVAAWHNSRVNVIDTDANTMTWYAGNGGRNYGPGEPGLLDTAVLDLPSSAVFASDGTLYFSDQANHMIRRITPDGMLEDVAGLVRHAGYSGDGGPAIEAELHGHTDQKADPGSKLEIDGDILYVTDTVNGMIRMIDLTDMTIHHVAGRYESLGTTTYVDAITGASYEADAGNVPGYDGDGGPAVDAKLNLPRDVAVGIDGELYIADTFNNCIRVVDTAGNIETFAGRCGEAEGYGGDKGPAVDATLNRPFGVAVDPDGNVYVSDTYNQIIRRIVK